MTPTEQAARWLADVPRYVSSDRGMQPDPLGAYLHWHDLLPAIARHLAPGDKLVEQATAALEGVTEGEWKPHHHDDYSELAVYKPEFTGLGHFYEAADADFTAFARQWVPEAAARLSALTAQVAELQAKAKSNVVSAMGQAWNRITVEAEVATLRDRLAQMEGAAKRVLAPLDEPCRYDHHGYCQEHFLEADCSVAALRAALTDGDKT